MDAFFFNVIKILLQKILSCLFEIKVERILFCRVNSSSDTEPYMKFVLLKSEVCRSLPSDSESPQTPLRLPSRIETDYTPAGRT
jgi:hypothetical protein